MYKIFLHFLFIITLISACNSGGSGNAIDTTGPLVTLADLESMVVDQMSYYVDEDISSPDIEAWLVDASSGEELLCAEASTGMRPVDIETIIYGNLNATFRRLSTSSGYLGRLFKVRVYHNTHTSCVRENSDESSERFLGETLAANIDSLTTRPLVATNGSFYIRLKYQSANAYPIPQAISDITSSRNIHMDQVYLTTDTNFGDSDNKPEIEVHVVDPNASDSMIACSGDRHGMDPANQTGLVFGKLFADLVNSSESLYTFNPDDDDQVKVIVIDNDGNACPSAIDTSNSSDNQNDDTLGESDVFLFKDLPGKKVTLTNGNGYVIFKNLSN